MCAEASNTDDENANIIREMIQHENELVNQRINWMSTIQGLLFASLAFGWEKAPGLIPLLCGLGGIIAIITIINVWLATEATQVLMNWHITKNPEYPGPPIIGLYIKSPINCKFIPYITSPAAWIAFAFIIAWFNVYQMPHDVCWDKTKTEVVESGKKV